MKKSDAERQLGMKVRKISDHTTVIERNGHAHPITPTEAELWEFIEGFCDED